MNDNYPPGKERDPLAPYNQEEEIDYPEIEEVDIIEDDDPLGLEINEEEYE